MRLLLICIISMVTIHVSHAISKVIVAPFYIISEDTTGVIKEILKKEVSQQNREVAFLDNPSNESMNRAFIKDIAYESGAKEILFVSISSKDSVSSTVEMGEPHSSRVIKIELMDVITNSIIAEKKINFNSVVNGEEELETAIKTLFSTPNTKLTTSPITDEKVEKTIIVSDEKTSATPSRSILSTHRKKQTRETTHYMDMVPPAQRIDRGGYGLTIGGMSIIDGIYHSAFVVGAIWKYNFAYLTVGADVSVLYGHKIQGFQSSLLIEKQFDIGVVSPYISIGCGIGGLSMEDDLYSKMYLRAEALQHQGDWFYTPTKEPRFGAFTAYPQVTIGTIFYKGKNTDFSIEGTYRVNYPGVYDTLEAFFIEEKYRMFEFKLTMLTYSNGYSSSRSGATSCLY